jgi:peptidoglycan/xylan/chitin deacetylase (PgdA/CDA1 family)
LVFFFSALPVALAFPVEKSPCGDGGSYPVHLTFDDGPQDPETARILDILKKEGIKATFFISSSRFSGFAKGKPSEAEVKRVRLLRRMIAEGHTVGSHSYEHIEHSNPGAVSQKDAEKNLRRNDEILRSLGLETPMPFRFPYGSGWFDDKKNQREADRMMAEVKERGFEPVHWDLDTWDWSKIKRKALPGSVLRQICSHQGGVLLMHDIQAFTAANLPALIESIRRSGHKFASLSEMKAINRKRPAGTHFVSLASRASGIFSCGRSVGDLDQVWPSCPEYKSHSSDIVSPKKSGSAQ